MRESIKRWICLFALLLSLFALITMPKVRNEIYNAGNKLTYTQSSKHHVDEISFYERVEKQRSCILEKLLKRSSVWAHWHIIINSCSANNKLSYLKFLKLRTDKLFIEFLKSQEHKCVSVTLGVGKETIMEKNLKIVYPQCQLYGVDPIFETGKPFEPYGKLFTMAVDDRASQMSLYLMGQSGKYEVKTVNTIPLGTFLHDYVKQPVIHYMSIDVEGSEYRLMPYLTKDGKFQSHSLNTVICQITLELHGYLERRGLSDSDFEKILIHFISRSPYVPLSAFKPGNHHRMYLYNVEAEECKGLFNLYSS